MLQFLIMATMFLGQSQPASPEDIDLDKGLEQQLTAQLTQLTDKVLPVEEKSAYIVELAAAKKTNVVFDLEAKLHEMNRENREAYNARVESMHEATIREEEQQTKRRTKQSDTAQLDEMRERRTARTALDKNYGDKNRGIGTLRNLCSNLKRAASFCDESCAHIKFRQDRKFLVAYRAGVRMLQQSFPSKSLIQIAIRQCGGGITEGEIQLAMKQCLEHHDAALQQLAGSHPQLAIQVLANMDSLYWMIQSSLKSWIGDNTLLSVNYDQGVYRSQPRERTIHVRTIAGAWSRVEQGTRIPDNLVQVACRWLDAYSPNAEIERLVKSPYSSGAASLRKRQKTGT